MNIANPIHQSLTLSGQGVHYLSLQFVALPAGHRNLGGWFKLQIPIMEDNQMATLALGPFVLKKTLRNLLMTQPSLTLLEDALSSPGLPGDHPEFRGVPQVRLLPLLPAWLSRVSLVGLRPCKSGPPSVIPG